MPVHGLSRMTEITSEKSDDRPSRLRRPVGLISNMRMRKCVAMCMHHANFGLFSVGYQLLSRLALPEAFRAHANSASVAVHPPPCHVCSSSYHGTPWLCKDRPSSHPGQGRTRDGVENPMRCHHRHDEAPGRGNGQDVSRHEGQNGILGVSRGMATGPPCQDPRPDGTSSAQS